MYSGIPVSLPSIGLSFLSVKERTSNSIKEMTEFNVTVAHLFSLSGGFLPLKERSSNGLVASREIIEFISIKPLLAPKNRAPFRSICFLATVKLGCFSCSEFVD